MNTKAAIILALWLLAFNSANAATSDSSRQHAFVVVAQDAKGLMPLDDPAEGTTQAELNTSTYPRKVDSLLNGIYQQILHDYDENTTFIKAFKKAHRAWLSYRDAEIKAIVPPEPGQVHGSITPLCTWQYKVALTKRRIEELLMWCGTDFEPNCESYLSARELQAFRNNKKP